MKKALALHQELMLLSLRDKEGTSIGCSYLVAIGGACLAELSLQKRIEIGSDKKRLVTVIRTDSTGDAILDELLNKIHSSKRIRSAQEWVLSITQMPKLKHRIAQQLCDRKILQQEEVKVLWLFRTNRYPEADSQYERALKQRMAKLMFGQTIQHDERTTIVIALAKAADLLKHNFDKDRLARNKERINKIAKSDMFAARATKQALATVQSTIVLATTVPSIVSNQGY